ncbi:hypothetical protein GGR52DRAFT_128677 [Hypoxylon sp. FL1284]|nr:hypothetical protein GGR52DRAFT_128677 [Hypoxylon sp. FL1284]
MLTGCLVPTYLDRCRCSFAAVEHRRIVGDDPFVALTGTEHLSIPSAPRRHQSRRWLASRAAVRRVALGCLACSTGLDAVNTGSGRALVNVLLHLRVPARWGYTRKAMQHTESTLLSFHCRLPEVPNFAGPHPSGPQLQSKPLLIGADAFDLSVHSNANDGQQPSERRSNMPASPTVPLMSSIYAMHCDALSNWPPS